MSIKSLNKDIPQLSKPDKIELLKMIMNRITDQSAVKDKAAGVYINSKKITKNDIAAIEIFIHNKLTK